MTTICCVCKKTKNNNRWVVKTVANPATVSHGYCPHCYRDVFSKMLQMYAEEQ